MAVIDFGGVQEEVITSEEVTLDRARQILRILMEKTGETANLGIEKSGSVLFVSQVETNASIRAFFPPGTLSPMHASGIGKVLLADMDGARLRRVLKEKKLEEYTKHTITEIDQLVAELANIRKKGFAIDGEEKNIGMRCIAAPVYDIHQEAVAGISVSGPTSRVDIAHIEHLSIYVREAAQALSLAIGGKEIPVPTSAANSYDD